MDAVYFLKKGTIQLVQHGLKGLPDLVYASFRDGAVIGEADFFTSNGDESYRRFTAKA